MFDAEGGAMVRRVRRHFDVQFPVWLGGCPGVATIRIAKRSAVHRPPAGWSFCLAGPFAIGLRIEEASRADSRARRNWTLNVLRGRDGVN